MEKKSLRQAARNERRLRSESSSWLHLASTQEFHDATTIASYISYGDEPSTIDINKRVLELGKTLLLPRTKNDYSLEWINFDGNYKKISRNPFFKKMKVLEPIGAVVAADEIDLVILPALLVDRAGRRLGQGGGSYDRALVQINAVKFALVHSHELVSFELPFEEHDQKVDVVVTPNALIRII